MHKASKSKMIIAREWLVFLVCLAIGFTLLPVAIMLVFKGEVRLGLFYSALFSGNERMLSWGVALAPYIIWQIVRSIVWAIRMTKTKDSEQENA